MSVSAPALEPVKIDRYVNFEVPPGWEFERKLGSGAYGHVASFKNGDGSFAVKKVSPSMRHRSEARCLLREIKLMQGLDHPTILGILDLWPGSGDDFSDVYIVTPLMDTDLHKILHVQKVKLTQHLVKILTYQLLQGVLVLQFASVIHRDLKPSNLLVDVRGRLKIGDLGLGRGTPDDDEVDLTQYVVTRWYRAPEIVLKAGCYTKAIDTWSVGCIVFEMLTNTILFKGKDYLDQVKSILSVVGTPKADELLWLTQEARDFVLQFERYPQKSVGNHDLTKDVDKQVIDLMDSALKFNPEHRADVTDMIKHPYLLSFYHSEHVDACREASSGAEGWVDAEDVLQGSDWSSVFRQIIMHDHKKFQRRNARKSARKAADGTVRRDSRSNGGHDFRPERRGGDDTRRRSDDGARASEEKDAQRRSHDRKPPPPPPLPPQGRNDPAVRKSSKDGTRRSRDLDPDDWDVVQSPVGVI
jgi:mitogen-activated protein kinase 1/3